MELTELIWMVVGLFLTLIVFSYLFGDNALFRLAAYLFVGITAGYVTTVVIYQVLWPRIILPLANGTFSAKVVAVVPLMLGVLLLFKLSPRLSPIGGIPVGYLVGAGAALAIGGAVFGTLFGQAKGTISSFDMQVSGNSSGSSLFNFVEAGLILIGTVTTLIYFHFTLRRTQSGERVRPGWMQVLARVGQVFMAITFGALYAGVFLASIAALIDRLDFIRDVVEKLVAL